MISLNDVLLAMSNIPVDDPIAEIWGRGLQSGYKIIEYTGTLPITITANGGALLDYRIYGTDGGVGVATENLIDANLSEQTIEIKPSTGYVICKYINVYAKYLIYGIYDENDNQLWGDYLGSFISQNIPIRDDAKYFKISIPDQFLNAVSLVEGRTPSIVTHVPETYIPYGYKLPMVTRTENLFDGQGEYNYGYYDNANGRFIDDENYKHWKFSVEEGDVIRWTTTGAGFGCYWSKGVYRGRFYTGSTPFTVPADVDEVTNNFNSSVWDSAMVTKNQPLPDQYVPYFRTDTPVYIGENQLDAGEYVSYGEQKIYKRTENLFDGNYVHAFIDMLSHVYSKLNNTRTAVVKVDPSTTYIVKKFDTSNRFVIAEAPEYPQLGIVYNILNTTNTSEVTITTGNDTSYILIYVSNEFLEPRLTVTNSLVNPDSFIPYIHVQDPPVPLPEIPTVGGTTVIDYDGDPKPSQMYVKYKGKG